MHKTILLKQALILLSPHTNKTAHNILSVNGFHVTNSKFTKFIYTPLSIINAKFCQSAQPSHKTSRHIDFLSTSRLLQYRIIIISFLFDLLVNP